MYSILCSHVAFGSIVLFDMLLWSDDFKRLVVSEYYLKKCDSKPKLVAMGAVSHKVCNMIFAILRDNKSFEIITPQEHIKQYNASIATSFGFESHFLR